MELLAGLALLAAVLGLLAVVGHGLWLLIAAAIGGLVGSSVPPAPAPGRRHSCPGCRATLLPIDRTCPGCGLDLDGGLAADLARLRAAGRDVRDLAHRGLLDADTADLISTRLDARTRD